MSLRSLRFTAQVMASGSDESAKFVRELMADPGRNPIGVRLFQTALGQAMQTHDWENMSQNERDRLVDDIVEGVKEKYVGSSVTPRHMQVVQGELQHSRDLHGSTLTEGISGQFVQDVDRVHFGLNGKPVGPKATDGRHTPDDLYEELRGNFRTKYGEDAPRMLAVVTSVANQSPLVGSPSGARQEWDFLPSGQWRNDRQHGDAGGPGARDDQHGGRSLLRQPLPRRRRYRHVPAAGQRSRKRTRRTCKSARWSVSRSSAPKRPVASRSSTPWIFPKRPSSTRTTSGTPR